MAKKVTIELNTKGINALLRGQEAADMVRSFARQAAARAGDGYGVRVHDSGQRQIANIYPQTQEAWQDNLESDALLRSISS